ncbi:GntR family transcriptional regulator [Pectobacterium aroidearum]|jgi:DNA-binding GntR family transcriptional regulator|uniref:GntR family transcriptional regulator n=1 Tax=Pectobacterium aroidearum TaxID=1201031 RepID=A0AAW3SRB8_9GAMM|nr:MULTISPECIES: GntR family transcriptional regulator [Pectobacterium]MBA5201727.1 GntR family transcriptional regulator [Pectobacterium aroidearum]MBA5204211.1 GntR family transcriptional regulator [Pectobacterium aroidearum]MBA5230006.1 GntR family transcriptional regulator [Pectobacterium aroidearum]MBA5234519.1 GntR family transcriptional regulator [Pectobacterium aroidearum]MBA5739694.1 GntR family transcriptional regulator [Pectobacterium aroidearum]
MNLTLNDKAPTLSPFEVLINAIEKGELLPGERLQETRLAKQFGLSRTPIREALHRLEALGLVEPGPQRGLMIAQISYERLRQLFAVREGLERLAMELAVASASAEELALLQDMVDVEKTLTDSRQLHDHNRLFHRQIYRATHNPYLNEMLENLRIHLSLLRGTTYESTERTEEARREHQAIVAALVRRDKDAAQEAACQHIRNGYRARLSMLNQQL